MIVNGAHAEHSSRVEIFAKNNWQKFSGPKIKAATKWQSRQIRLSNPISRKIFGSTREKYLSDIVKKMKTDFSTERSKYASEMAKNNDIKQGICDLLSMITKDKYETPEYNNRLKEVRSLINEKSREIYKRKKEETEGRLRIKLFKKEVIDEGTLKALVPLYTHPDQYFNVLGVKVNKDLWDEAKAALNDRGVQRS